MFFPLKIKGISDKDKVLDIGPGGDPYPRSDIYLELEQTEDELAAQRGYAEKPKLTKPIVYYKGDAFPFKDAEFDYVICSHVLEHVDNVEKFVNEIFRVAKKGVYLEYPTIYYEYLHNFEVHKNVLAYKNGTLYYLKKEELGLAKFAPVQDFFYKALGNGYTHTIDALQDYMFEGFETFTKPKVKKVKNIEDILPDRPALKPYAPPGKPSRKSQIKVKLTKLLENR